jgi:hypothetical protein
MASIDPSSYSYKFGFSSRNKWLLHTIYKKLTENFNMFWKTRIFDDSLTANGNKLRTYEFENKIWNNFIHWQNFNKTIYANKN